MEEINGTGIIEEINNKEGTKGWYYKLKIGGRTYNTFSGLDAFKQLEDKLFKTGDAVAFEYSEHTIGENTFKNLQRLRNIGSVENKGTPTKTTTPSAYTPPVNKTGQQIVRMNALTNAIKFFEVNKTLLLTDGMVRDMAELFEEWVTR